MSLRSPENCSILLNKPKLRSNLTAVENFDLLSERVELSEVGDIQGEDVHVGVPVGEVHQLLGLEMVDSLELSYTGNPYRSGLLMRLFMC